LARSSALIDTRVIYCGDCLDQLRKLPDECVDLIYIDPPFNSNRNYASEVRDGETAGLGFMDEWYPIQVKQKDKMGRPEVDQFETAMQRANRKKGFLVAFDYSSDAITEIDAFFRRSGCVIIPLTVAEILTEQIARKLA
jgi:DNA modification methylase